MKMKTNKSALFLMGAICALNILLLHTSCRNETIEGEKPIISWNMSGVRFTIYTNEELTIAPDVSNTDETSIYQWYQNDKAVSTKKYYTFSEEKSGVYYVRLRVSNRFGTDEDEVKITVVEKEVTTIDSIPDNDSIFRWVFAFSEINIPIGAEVAITPYILENPKDGEWSWTVNGIETEDRQKTLVFKGEEEGTVSIHARLSGDSINEEKEFLVHVCPKAGRFIRNQGGKADANRIYAYMPAPGHQVNGFILTNKDRLSFPSGCTHEDACDSVLLFFERGWSISLGGCGGYVTAGFDHSIMKKETGNELCIKGNPFDYQSEPGIIWVSQDVNGDGIPNDLWYELGGSEYGTENHFLNYAITYYHPTRPCSATVWKDNRNESGHVPYMSYWNKEEYYWAPWIAQTECTYFGSALASKHTYEDGISHMPPYEWGYTDNLGSDYDKNRGMGFYSLKNARTWDGKKAELEFIDFIKVQTAQAGWTPNLGEISTEVYCIRSNE